MDIVDEILDDETDAEKILDTRDCCLMPSVVSWQDQIIVWRDDDDFHTLYMYMYTHLWHLAGFCNNNKQEIKY